MIPKSIIAALIVRICTGSISLLASGFLCFTIWVSPKGLQSPYSRIIFGFSVADVLQSIGVVLSPFLSPANDPDYIFSKGTVASCEGIGFILIMGSHAILWYILFLTYYFLKRVKYKQTPQDFAKCEEKLISTFIWIYAIATSVYPLIKEQINATKHGGVCMIAPRPFDCVTNGEECTRGENANRSVLLFSIILVVIVFLLLIIVLVTFTCYMYNAEKAIQPTSGSNNDNAQRRTHKGMDLTKQAAHQSILYILAFLLVYSGTILALILRLLKVENTAVTFWFVSLFYPIGGFLNMIIYTRPKVQALKKLIPELPNFVAFFIVILAGGETPSLADLGFDDRNRPISTEDIHQRTERMRMVLYWTKALNMKNLMKKTEGVSGISIDCEQKMKMND
ncbi:hypothetical protein CTEN210_18115 [Chaetoceros tenuissimus]|uniref:G-protein coupled receptors family 1 profile domain-containing protein n=1 Tax=Chaetoceros tenuissimus TaxID=426638 RepID=A0AAD3HFV7_9STRA|nr:hypothetical protein CTEN210_18115 [Chaetoceros tenuissimus]